MTSKSQNTPIYSKHGFTSHRGNPAILHQEREESRGCACEKTDNLYQNMKVSDQEGESEPL